MTISAELIRFILPMSPSSRTAFSQLRRLVEVQGLARSQRFGYVRQNEGYPQPKPENQICWYIEWSEISTGFRASEEFKQALLHVADETNPPRSVLLRLAETKPGEIARGLRSNERQFAIIKLSPQAPRLEAKFEESMHKTFTDCYLAKGFEGGGWGYVLDGNDADGQIIDTQATEKTLLQERDRRLAYYLIGWNSIAEHHAYAKTELFDEEINKLMPYFGPGTGAFYVDEEGLAEEDGKKSMSRGAYYEPLNE